MKKLCRFRLLRVIALAFALGGGTLLAAGCEREGEMEEAVEELEDEAEDAADEVEDALD